MTAQRLDDALALIEEWVGPRGVAGAAAVVWQHGKVVAERYAGEAQPDTPVVPATLFALASVTKPITATTVMTLVEDGLLALDEPVGRIVSEFGARAASEADGADAAREALRPGVTVRHLLAHTSGLPEDLGPRQFRYGDGSNLDAITDAMSRLPLQSAPGVELRYSNAGYAILARIVERLTGEPFWQVARRRVLDPLGLGDIVAAPAASLEDRIALVAGTAHAGTDLEPYNGAYWRGLALPWGGLFGTARDAVRFAGSFLPTGPRVIAPPTVRLMTTDQAEGVPGGIESGKVRWRVAHWGLGWELKGGKRRHWTGDLTSPATFCHFGHAGTLVWGDPTQDLALAVFTNRTVTHHWTFILGRWARLSNAVVAAATRDA